MPNNSVFPDAFYGKPGVPAGGPLSFSDMYGKSNLGFWLSNSAISINGYNKSESITATSLPAGAFTIALISGTMPTARWNFNTATGVFTANSPLSTGNPTGAYSARFRITSVANGLSGEIDVSVEYGEL